MHIQTKWAYPCLRSAWAAREGGNWAVLAASGIPFGIGAFSLFVSPTLQAASSKPMLTSLTLSSQRSAIW